MLAAIVAVLAGADAMLLGVGVVSMFAGGAAARAGDGHPIARVLGAPGAAMRGVTGAMARGNVQRNPRAHGAHRGAGADRCRARHRRHGVRRVDQGAAAPDDRSTLRRRVRRSTRSNGGSLSFSQDFVDEVNTLPEVGAATGLGFARWPTRDGERAGGASDRPADGRRAARLRLRRGLVRRADRRRAC